MIRFLNLENKKDLLKALEAWKNYAISMNKRRPGLFINFNGWIRNIVARGSMIATHDDKSFACGILKEVKGKKVYVITHFAPENLKSGYKLIRELKEWRDGIVVFAVTEDLAFDLKRIGYKELFKKDTWFRGLKVEKHVLVSKLDWRLVMILKNAMNGPYNDAETIISKVDYEALDELLVINRNKWIADYEYVIDDAYKRLNEGTHFLESDEEIDEAYDNLYYMDPEEDIDSIFYYEETSEKPVEYGEDNEETVEETKEDDEDDFVVIGELDDEGEEI